MPSLLHSPFPALIRTVPVEKHSIAVTAAFWRPRFHRAGKTALWTAIFGGIPNIHITRNKLFTFVYPTLEQKCAEVLLWGYPSNQHGIVTGLLPVLCLLPSLAATPKPWPRYFGDFKSMIKGIGVSTITKLAYFFRINFGGYSALILDSRLTQSTASWHEVSLPGLSYSSAPARYPDYLRILHSVATRIKCTPDQLEFFLFTFGDCFDP